MLAIAEALCDDEDSPEALLSELGESGRLDAIAARIAGALKQQQQTSRKEEEEKEEGLFLRLRRIRHVDASLSAQIRAGEMRCIVEAACADQRVRAAASFLPAGEDYVIDADALLFPLWGTAALPPDVLRRPISVVFARPSVWQKSWLASCLIDWRKAALRGGVLALSAELRGIVCGALSGVAVIDVECEVSLPAKGLPRGPPLDLESKRLHEFREACQRRLSAFLHINEQCRGRSVTPFDVAAEDGTAVLISSFVAPISSPLPTPLHALRFVSLLGTQQQKRSIAGWISPFTLIVAHNASNAQSKACLLCSLFLGLGMDGAFVCVGRTVRGEKAFWVATEGLEETSAMHWDPSSCSSFLHRDAESLGFSALDFAFNNRTLVANVQPFQSLAETSMDFADAELWMPLCTSDEIAEHSKPLVCIAHLETLQPFVSASDIEWLVAEKVKRAVAEFRSSAHLNAAVFAVLDQQTILLFRRVLHMHELAKLSGSQLGGHLEGFYAAIKRRLPPGQRFIGVPLEINGSSNEELAFEDTAHPEGLSSVLGTPSGSFVLHVLAETSWPEDVRSAWVMLGVIV